MERTSGGTMSKPPVTEVEGHRRPNQVGTIGSLETGGEALQPFRLRHAPLAVASQYLGVVGPETAASKPGIDVFRELFEVEVDLETSPRNLDRAPSLGDVLPSIVARMTEGVLLVHCAMVDVPFLRPACAREGLRWPRPQVVDTMRLLARLARRPDSEPGPPVALAAARAHFGLPTHRSHHDLSDAMATAELFLMLVHRLKARRLHGLL